MVEIALAFDVIVMVMLIITIFFAVKLSRHLDSFRSNRADMERLIRELSMQITRAQEGISTLDELSSARGDELRKSITKAQTLIDELDIMTDSADSLANRLENLATRNRTLADSMEKSAMGLTYPGVQPDPVLKAKKPFSFEETLPKVNLDEDKKSNSFFTIRDPDFEAGEEDEERVFNDEFSSQAERDLADALKRRVPKGK